MGAITTTIALSLLFIGIEENRSSLSMAHSMAARESALACTEHALVHIVQTANVDESGSMPVGENTCSYQIVASGVDQGRVESQSEVGAVVHKVKVEYTIVSSTLSVHSWADVVDF